METIDTTELWLQLSERDITYQFSDSGPEWAAGRDELDAIISAAHQSPENRALYDCWVEMENAGVYGGPPLTHRGYDVTRIAPAKWVVSTDREEICCASTARGAVNAINALLDRPLPDNILPFTRRYQL